MPKKTKAACSGCRNNLYNGNNDLGTRECWSFNGARFVKRISIGHWEEPPYLGKETKFVLNCWHGEGNQRVHWVDPNVLTADGFWK